MMYLCAQTPVIIRVLLKLQFLIRFCPYGIKIHRGDTLQIHERVSPADAAFCMYVQRGQM